MGFQKLLCVLNIRNIKPLHLTVQKGQYHFSRGSLRILVYAHVCRLAILQYLDKILICDLIRLPCVRESHCGGD